MDSFTGGFRFAYRVVRLDLGVDGTISAESSLDDIFSGAIRSTARQFFACFIYFYDSFSDAFDDDREFIAY